jgi:Virulence-associated protein E
MSVIEFPTIPDWLAKYYDRGFRLIFYDSGQKGPSGPKAVDWTSRSDQPRDYREGMNVGIFLGHEIKPGKFLADIDFDYTEGLNLAKGILPSTEFAFGRASRRISHAFYTTAQPIPSTKFKHITGKDIVELRGSDIDGSCGHQTMAPPSLHPSGETVTLQVDGEIGHCEDLLRLTALYATACLIFSQLGQHGHLHDVRLALAGFLLSEGLTQEETIKISQSIARATGNNEEDAATTVRSTAGRIKSGEHVYGKTALIKALGDNGQAVVARIKEWLGGSDFIEDAKGRVLANSQVNVKRGLEKLGVTLTFDSFAQKPLVELNGQGYRGPLVDAVVNKVWLDIDEKYHFRPAREFFNAVVDNIAYVNQYHPVKDYLKSLKWDGESRVETWLIRSGGAADTDYVRAVSKIMLLAAVRRVMSPGCKYDEMVVLESATQGLLKSTALRTLCPNDKWFSDDLPLNVDAKQIVERTLGKWIIEASDLSGMRPASVEHLKGMLSRQSDGPVRLAYGRIPIEQPRQFIIVGTTNSYTYLTDSTGNRRFWPIRIKAFDIEFIKANRDQIWAESVMREASGESIRLHPSLYSHASMQQERRRAIDPWEIKLDEIFDRQSRWRLTHDQVWAALGIGIDKRDQRSNERMLKAMDAIEFRKMSVRNDEGKVVKGFGREVLNGQMDLDRRDDASE